MTSFGQQQAAQEYPGLKTWRRNRKSLHYVPPDFLSRTVALGICMRLSLRRVAHVEVASSAK
jgi:hypothetical protein